MDAVNVHEAAPVRKTRMGSQWNACAPMRIAEQVAHCIKALPQPRGSSQPYA